MILSTVDRNFELAKATPSDINEHLQLLFDLAKQCDSVVELGVRTAVSSTALIAARPASLVSYDIVLLPEALAIFDAGVAEGIHCGLIQASSFDIELPEVDFIFIDTDHTYDCLSKELSLHGNKARKFLAFHDTVSCEGQLMPAINEFREANPEWTVHSDCRNNNGLLVLSR